MTCITSRSWLATLTLASSSRLRAPKAWTSRPLTTAPSSALNDKPQSQSTTRSKGQLTRPRRAPSAHLSAAATHSTRSNRHTADQRLSATPQQKQYSESQSEPSQTSPSSSSSSRDEKRPLLQPYELSRRLIALCKRGDVDLAVTVLQKAPRNAQNIKVWNTIIQQCMGAKKYKLAYSVFTDMKRRGFVPNIRTYATMMSGYATIDDWTPLTAQLELVHSLYGQLKQHIKRTDNLIDDPVGKSNTSFILYPIALYISILGKAGQYQKAFDVFHALDTSGPLAPYPKIYSSLLSVLAERVDATDAPDAEFITQSVSEAKYIWRRHMRCFDKDPQHDVEPRSIENMIKLLSRGNSSDHELMFDILRDICGLPGPSDGHPSSPPSQKKNVALTTWMLNEILDGCITAGRPEMAVHYAQSVMDTRKLRPILRAWHLHKLLNAHILLAKKGSVPSYRAENAAAWVEWMVAQDPARKSKEMTPNEYTMVIALELCHRCKDMHSALRIARAMIFDDSQRGTPTGTAMRGGSRSLALPLPDRGWEHLFRLANTGAAGVSQDEKRQCFELWNSYGSTAVLDVWELTSEAIERLAPRERKSHISLALHVALLITDLPSSDNENAADKPHAAADLEARSDIRKRAESFLERAHRRKSRRGSVVDP